MTATMRSATGVLSLLCTLLTAALLKAEECDFQDFTRCSVGFEAKRVLGRPPNWNAIIFHDMKIECDGKISRWSFFSEGKGMVYLDVWRPLVNNTNKIQLIGTNAYNVKRRKTKIIYDVPREQQIMVKAGDELGIHYAKYDRANGVPNIWYDKTKKCHGSMYELGKWTNKETKQSLRKYHSEPIHVDRNHNLPYGCPSINADIVNVNPEIRLSGDKTNYRGLLEVKVQGKWCTVCDKWTNVYGVPMSVCKEMGFHNTTSKVYKTSNPAVAEAFRAPKDQCIAIMNPRGKLSQCKHLVDFELSPTGSTCDHDQDLYLQCVPKQRLMDPHNSESTGVRDMGVPVTYQYGEWKLICDPRPAQWHYDNRERSWVQAFCKELHYRKGFAFIREFKTDLYEVGYENPRCTMDNAEHMGDCPSVHKENDRCKETTYFITCDKKSYQSDGPGTTF